MVSLHQQLLPSTDDLVLGLEGLFLFAGVKRVGVIGQPITPTLFLHEKPVTGATDRLLNGTHRPPGRQVQLLIHDGPALVILAFAPSQGQLHFGHVILDIHS